MKIPEAGDMCYYGITLYLVIDIDATYTTLLRLDPPEIITLYENHLFTSSFWKMKDD